MPGKHDFTIMQAACLLRFGGKQSFQFQDFTKWNNKTRSSSAFILDVEMKDQEKMTRQKQSRYDKVEKLGKKLNKNLFYYLDNGGSHNELFWGKRFRPMLDFYRQ